MKNSKAELKKKRVDTLDGFEEAVVKNKKEENFDKAKLEMICSNELQILMQLNEDDDADGPMLTETGKDGASFDSPQHEEEVLNERALQHIQVIDVKAQNKAQQGGRKKARYITKHQQLFCKQKQLAMEEATTALLLGTQLDGSSRNQQRGNA